MPKRILVCGGRGAYKAAGHIRNKQMLDTGIDVVIAFPGGRGTANMVKIAKEANVQVWQPIRL